MELENVAFLREQDAACRLLRADNAPRRLRSVVDGSVYNS